MNLIFSTVGKGNFFSGYYDKVVYKNGLLLCHKANGELKKLPDEDEVVEIGCFDIKSGLWKKLGETTAWNWQQGSNLSYIGDEIGFNYRDSNSKKVTFKIIDAEGNEKRSFERPAVAYSSFSDFYLSTSLNLLTNIRASYSYAGYLLESATTVDKLIKVCLITGEEDVLVDALALQEYLNINNGVITIEHPIVSPDDSKVIFLARQRYNGKQKSYLFIYNIKLRNLTLYNKLHRVSHCCWADTDTIIGFGNLGSGINSSKASALISRVTPIWLRKFIKLLFLQKPNETFKLVTDGYFSLDYITGNLKYIKKMKNLPDGHPGVIVNKDNALEIITDTYPDKSGVAYVYRVILEGTYSDESLNRITVNTDVSFANTGYRSDLHPKLNEGFCVLDVAVNGRREVNIYEL